MRNEKSEDLKRGIESQHGGTATFVESVLVKENYRGQTVWQGVVDVFDLTGNPHATRAYAWSEPIQGSEKRKVFAVLHVPPVDSPLQAVRATIVHRQKQAS